MDSSVFSKDGLRPTTFQPQTPDIHTEEPQFASEPLSPSHGPVLCAEAAGSTPAYADDRTYTSSDGTCASQLALTHVRPKS